MSEKVHFPPRQGSVSARGPSFSFAASVDHGSTTPSQSEEPAQTQGGFYLGIVLVAGLLVTAGWEYLNELDARIGRPHTPTVKDTTAHATSETPKSLPSPAIRSLAPAPQKQSSRLQLGPALPMHTLEKPPSTIFSPLPRRAEDSGASSP